MRSHENTPYAWTDSMMSPTAKDTMTIIDKATLKPVATVMEPGKTLAHIEFTKDGKYALASVWEMDGALIVYDAATFKEIKRLPMSKPVGKYNVWNKISRSARERPTDGGSLMRSRAWPATVWSGCWCWPSC